MAHLTPTEPEQQEQSEIGRQLRPPSKEPGSSFERPTDDGESQSPTSNHQNFMSHLKGIFWLLFPRACIERNFTGPLKEAVQPCKPISAPTSSEVPAEENDLTIASAPT